MSTTNEAKTDYQVKQLTRETQKHIESLIKICESQNEMIAELNKRILKLENVKPFCCCRLGG
jgi:GTP1/Obg family GTP-binding protein